MIRTISDSHAAVTAVNSNIFQIIDRFEKLQAQENRTALDDDELDVLGVFLLDLQATLNKAITS